MRCLQMTKLSSNLYVYLTKAGVPKYDIRRDVPRAIENKVGQRDGQNRMGWDTLALFVAGWLHHSDNVRCTLCYCLQFCQFKFVRSKAMCEVAGELIL